MQIQTQYDIYSIYLVLVKTIQESTAQHTVLAARIAALETL